MKKTLIQLSRVLLTALIFAAAVGIGVKLWKHYMYRPWTRDGRVRAEIVKVAPDVSGLVDRVCVKDNQPVKKGDLLLVIDPSRYRLAVKQAESQVGSAEAQLLSVEAQGSSESQPRITDARARLAVAKSALELAKLNLERTEVRSAVNGHVANLSVYAGDYANTGTPKLAVIDSDSLWVYGYFEETKLPRIRVGDEAEVELMSGAPKLRGHVESIAHGISDRDNPQGGELLANVNPTFSWVRLAQRIPVRIHIDDAPKNALIIAGMTCTVVIKPHGRGDGEAEDRTR